MITFDIAVKRQRFTVYAKGELPKGITVLTGSSGSGKSTIIKVIAGLLVPETGFIRMDDTLWMDMSRKLYLKPQQRNVGYMPQGNIIFPHLTVRDNIRYSKKGDEQLYQVILDKLGLRRYEHLKAKTLSGGEQQRVALGRSLYAKPQILLLDEPLSALDPDLRDQVAKDMVNVIDEWDIPCLWVTHDIQNLEGVDYHHWHMREGQLSVIK